MKELQTVLQVLIDEICFAHNGYKRRGLDAKRYVYTKGILGI